MRIFSDFRLGSLALVGLLLASCAGKAPVVADYEVVPIPLEIKTVQEASFVMKDGTTIYYTVGNEKMRRNAEFLASYVESQTGIRLNVKEGGEGQKGILLQLGLEKENPEAYSLEVKQGQVVITAPTEAGVFYGIQTLRKSIGIAEGGSIELPAVSITDEPRFGYRGMMLDVSRHFFSVDDVKCYIDMLALHNINRLHWHLSDDQGWRIEIKKYPKLTEVGAFRDSSEINHFHSNVFDGKPHGGFYTQDDIKEVVDYAAKRHIMIVPEIEMPGHASAAIASYPWLGTTGKQIKVPCNFGVHYNAYNVADPRVIQFQEDVLEEVIALFPSPVIHIGGDELRYNAWKESPMVRNYMKQNKITSPGGLQVFFTNNISNFLASKNRHMMGWNEITGAQVNDYQRDGSGASQQQLAPGTIVHFWKGEPELIKETIEKGYDIVNSYHIYTYLDYDYESIPLQKSYEFNPIPEGLTEAQQSKVFGIGCQMWGEFIPTVESMNKKIYPRLAAYAEVGWTNPSNKDFDRFRNSLNSFIGHWEKLGIQLGEWK